ncbi:MAG TPA: hypothetical protein EYP10_14555, partial [Armatimonadetes bacterium]|nr:hypothetical protein [Armatimonadota bacterium]
MTDAMHTHDGCPGNAWINLPIAALFIGACLPLAWAMWQPMGYIIERFTPDDVFYYLKTAMNIAQGHGSTFDGVNRTNGYHPLWMLLLVPIY